ncbi:MAG: hypothetical protein WC980_00935 [Candidatus Brocadiia bacterium]
MLNIQNSVNTPVTSQGAFMCSEIKNIAQDYCSGKYRELEKDLESFIKQNKEGIKKFKTSVLPELRIPNLTEELAIKMYIVKAKSINHLTEIKTELDEIEKEIWYTGEKNKKPANRDEVAKEWCKKHAPGWRDRWVMAALYVFEHNKQHYLKLLE